MLATFTSVTAGAQGGRLTADQFALLTERLRNSSAFKVRLQAALLLGAAGGADAEPVLVTALREDKHPAVRAAAALGLGQTQDPRAIDPLLSAMADDDPLLRGQSEKGLGQLAQSVPSGALKVWEGLARSPALVQARGLTVLGTLGAGGVPGLCAAASVGNEGAKGLAREELAKLPKDQLLAGLRETLKLKDADLSPVAAAMLGDQGDGIALPSLADAVSDPTQPQAVSTEARSALVRLAAQIDPASEQRRFESDDPQERMRAVLLLSVKGGAVAEQVSLKALRDGTLRVQAAGASAAADLGVLAALPKIKALTEKEEEAPILRVLQIAARRLERKQSASKVPAP